MNIEIDDRGPLLVFGGPYSNLAATEAIRRIGADLGIPARRTICTGDVVAYCAEPEETAALIREWGCHVIRGNCEESLADDADDCGCGFGAGSTCDLLSRRWYSFARAAVSAETRTWMKGLPGHLSFSLSGRRVKVIHGRVAETAGYVFASTAAETKAAELEAAEADIVIGGHCGLPFVSPAGTQGWWINAGVIGMPANDGTPDGWYAVISQAPSHLLVELKRLGYDADRAAAKLSEAGFAEPYAEALRTGLWPSLDVLPAAERRQTGEALTEATVIIPLDRG